MIPPLRREACIAPQMAALFDADDEQRRHLLGGALLGAAVHAPVPLQTLGLPLLGESGAAAGELWFSASPCRQGEHDGICYSCDGRVLYGVVEIDEDDFASTADAYPLSRATEAAYRSIFALLDREGYPHLWRTWNYLAAINEDVRGLERYRQFNIGRHQAFATRDQLSRETMPAACALGLAAGPLSIAFLAGRTPPTAVENPRQVAAYDYPADYGPRSPAFARAVVAHLPGQELLFISGTASILGHATVHRGDIAAQMGESLANVAAVVAEADRQSAPQQSAAWRCDALAYRVYLRHAADYAAARAILQEIVGAEAVAIYVQADICRADLLVEVEAYATRAAASATI